MLKFLSRIKPVKRREVIDAKRIYQKTMHQSRVKSFFNHNYYVDNYDGRMEVLCLHLALILYTLRRFGDNGARLSQALYDVMIADFDTALREEGLSDAGVKRRIKPLAEMFFSRAKQYTEALDNAVQKNALEIAILANVQEQKSPAEGKKLQNDSKLGIYANNLVQSLSNLSLGDIANGEFNFPSFA